MKTQSAKAKGRLLQQKVRDTILGLHKTFRANDVKSTSMGAGGEDVQLSPFVRDRLPISIECKSYAKVAIYKWYDQAKDNSEGNEPVLVVKQNHRKPLVCVDMEHYFDMHKRLMEYEDNER